MNATDYVYGHNRTDCFISMENFYFSGDLAYSTLTSSGYFSWFNMLNALDHFVKIPYSIHTMVYSCYHGAIEVIDLTKEYSAFASDGEIILFNLFYNIGYIYESVRNIVFYFNMMDYTRVKTASDFGFEMGLIARLLFYPTKAKLDAQM